VGAREEARVDWLMRDWDRWQAGCGMVGVIAGVALVLSGTSVVAEVVALTSAVGCRYASWQIPPSGRSKAEGSPPDALPRLSRLAVAVLIVVLVAEVLRGLAS
jgi:hypothetical protein